MVRGREDLATRVVDHHPGSLVVNASQASSLLRKETLYSTFPVRQHRRCEIYHIVSFAGVELSLFQRERSMLLPSFPFS